MRRAMKKRPEGRFLEELFYPVTQLFGDVIKRFKPFADKARVDLIHLHHPRHGFVNVAQRKLKIGVRLLEHRNALRIAHLLALDI